VFALAVTVPPNLIAGFLLALVRTSAWVVITPPFAGNLVNTRVKVLIAASIALVLAPSVKADPNLFQFGTFAAAVFYQAFVGLALGFAVYLVFAVVQTGGEIIDLQAGFAAARLYDPLTNAASTPIGRLYQLVATTLLFALNGHLLLVKGFMTSFQAAPLSGPSLNRVGAMFTAEIGRFLLSALEIAAPLLAALFLTELAMGLLNRAAPQMNVMTIGFVIKILLALLMVGLALPILSSVVDGIARNGVGAILKLGR
jgi:flagellar biosynthetic protein FliR